MNNFFTHRNITEGKVGIGKLPNTFQYILDNLSNEYYNMIPDKSKTTFHTYYKDLNHDMKHYFDKIQYDNFWNNICDNTNNCIIKSIIEMNEIYYSNPKPNFLKTNLYGAAANLIPHRDCILYNFYGISVYRVIIGLTNNNNDTITEFVNIGLEHKINSGDYIIFDFDKTMHQVKKIALQETPRIMLKLHYIVCENCKYSIEYVNFVSLFYKNYYIIARYTEQIGTDPTSFTGFFFGILWEWPFNPSFKYIVLSAFVSDIIVLNVFYKIKNVRKLLLYSFSNMFTLYLLIVSFYYFRYVLFKIK
uniref:Aspartyl/asparaginy/proline hydroxylase domain-containing protein n=1 Tax=viral metagenome TaxID=1070528 RepID=A0A6C0DEA9_9ZZZZ